MDSELRRRGGKGERRSEATEFTGAGSHEAEQGLQVTSDFQPKWELRISEGSTGTVKLVAAATSILLITIFLGAFSPIPLERTPSQGELKRAWDGVYTRPSALLFGEVAKNHQDLGIVPFYLGGLVWIVLCVSYVGQEGEGGHVDDFAGTMLASFFAAGASLWSAAIVTTLALSTIGSNAVVPVHVAPLLTQQEILSIRRLVSKEVGENMSAWIKGRHDDYPTLDAQLNESSTPATFQALHGFLQARVESRVKEAYFFGGREFNGFTIGEFFYIRYGPDERKMLPLHRDPGSVTVSIFLSRQGQDFEGGGIHFDAHLEGIDGQGVASIVPPQGHGIIFPSQALHASLPLSSGEAHVITICINFPKQNRLQAYGLVARVITLFQHASSEFPAFEIPRL